MESQRINPEVPLARLNPNYINTGKYNAYDPHNREKNMATQLKVDQIRKAEMHEFSKEIVPIDQMPILAEDAESIYHRQQTVRDIQEMPNDYKLRCTKGSYQGRFITLNHSVDGEILGSGDPEKVQLSHLTLNST